MSLFLAWVVFPLAMSVLSLGLGLLVETLAGVRLPGALLLPTGFAAMIVVTGLTTMASSTAELSTPAVVALAAAGLLAGFRRARSSDNWAALSAFAVFGVFAAPVVLAGSATFTGWIKLDDTATWLALADRVMTHGRSLAGLAHSSYEVTLDDYIGHGYPVGSFVPLGVGGQLVRQDLAWLAQPYMAFMAALLALAIYSLASRFLTSRVLCFVTAFVAAQAATLYGYALWGGIKEVAAALLIALVAALVPPLLAPFATVRDVIPLSLASAATLGVLTLGGGIWLAAVLVPALVLALRAHGTRFALEATSVFVGVGAVLALPTIAITRSFAESTSSSSVLTKETELGNLFQPLKFVQVVGIWPTGDFRVNPHDLGPTYVLIVVAACAAVFGVVAAVRRGAPAHVLYLASALAGAIVAVQLGSPWVGGKALAIAAPALIAAAVMGASALFEGGRRTEGVVVLTAIAGGVLWSNVLAYHDVSLAPRAQLAELETIGDRYDGEGPALMTEYNPYGAYHFLRELDPENASGRRWRQIPLLNGRVAEKGADVDIDDFQTQAVLEFRTLVLRRSATASRPPSVYRLVWHGRFYEVWQRPTSGAPRILEHLALGNRLQPAVAPTCAQVLRLARLAGESGRLAAVERPEPRLYDLSASPPPGWSSDPLEPGAVLPTGKGDVAREVRISEGGRYSFWLGGSFRDQLEFFVDARRLFSGRHQLNWPGKYTPLGEATLRPGRHLLLVRYGGSDLRPGSGGEQRSFGPLVFGRSTADAPVTYVPADDARSLCGRPLDWVEALAS